MVALKKLCTNFNKQQLQHKCNSTSYKCNEGNKYNSNKIQISNQEAITPAVK